MNSLNPGESLRNGVDNSCGIIARAVIDYNPLDRLNRLPDNRVNRLLNVLLFVPDRRNDHVPGSVVSRRSDHVAVLPAKSLPLLSIGKVAVSVFGFIGPQSIHLQALAPPAQSSNAEGECSG